MEKEKKCFIITPIGDENSDTFRKAKGVIESVIKPILQENGFTDIKPSYEIAESGMIGNQIVNRIINDDLVIANLTGNNPNVMYELAIRHTVAKPIIHICENRTILPFDIKDNRTIFYVDDMLGVQELQIGIKNFIKQLDYQKEYRDNPIYNAIKVGNLFKEMNDEGKQSEADILQKILHEISELKTTQTCQTIITHNQVIEGSGFHEIRIRCKGKEEDVKRFCRRVSERARIVIDDGIYGEKGDFILYNNEKQNAEQLMGFLSETAKEYGVEIEALI